MVNSPVVGSRSRAFTIAWAWAMLTRPAPKAVASAGWWSRGWLRLRSDRGGDPGLPGLLGDPVRGGGGGVFVGGAAAVGLAEDLQPQCGELGFGLGQVGQRGALFLGSHRPGGDVGQLVESRAEASGEVGDRVGPVELLAAHGPNSSTGH